MAEFTLSSAMHRASRSNFPQFTMDTLKEEEPTTQETTEVETLEATSEETVADDTSKDEEESAAETKRLADKDRYIKELEAKVNKAKVPDTRSEEIKDLEWKLENKERITLVKDEYETILAEGYEGEKVSKKIALELAEKKAKIDNSGTARNRSNDMTVASVTNRNSNPKGYEDDLDRELGLTQERKRKLEKRHAHLTA